MVGKNTNTYSPLKGDQRKITTVFITNVYFAVTIMINILHRFNIFLIPSKLGNDNYIGLKDLYSVFLFFFKLLMYQNM